MTTVTVSPKFQVVIPSEIRTRMGVKPGQKLEVLAYEGRLELIPVAMPDAMRGRLRGIDTVTIRDKDRV